MSVPPPRDDYPTEGGEGLSLPLTIFAVIACVAIGNACGVFDDKPQDAKPTNQKMIMPHIPIRPVHSGT